MDAIARRAPSSQEGARQSGARQRRGGLSSRYGGRVLKSEKGGGWSGRRSVTREIPFHSFGAHRKSRALRAEFDIMHKSSAIRARLALRAYAHWLSLSGHRLGLPHTSAFFCVSLRSATMRHDICCIFAALFILKLLGYCLMWL